MSLMGSGKAEELIDVAAEKQQDASFKMKWRVQWSDSRRQNEES